MPKNENLSAWVPVPVKQYVEKLAKDQNVPISYIMRDIINFYMEAQNKENERLAILRATGSR